MRWMGLRALVLNIATAVKEVYDDASHVVATKRAGELHVGRNDSFQQLLNYAGDRLSILPAKFKPWSNKLDDLLSAASLPNAIASQYEELVLLI
mmetsp:Transcript_115838/g.212283  ORF Transcript_115838/g.212283 Transcript_115838/m.212283 type:complete len:94 (+) Transcript_115838:1332-1613(+)